MQSCYIFNPDTNLKLGPIDKNDLYLQLSKQNNYLECFFWEEGMADWKNVKLDQGLVLQIEKLIKKNAPPPPPPVQITPTPPPFPLSISNQSIEINEPQIEVQPVLVEVAEAGTTGLRENRKNVRYTCQLRTILISKKKTFITTTVDISLGGIKVSHPIPLEIFEGICDVYIHSPNNKESIILKCSSVSDSTQSHRFSFSNMDSKNTAKLELWLETLPEKK